MTPSTCLALFGSALHLGFAFGEMIPVKAGLPYILNSVLEEKNIEFTAEQLKLVKTIVLNAGAYNLIIGLGFLWAAYPIGLNGRILLERISPLRVFFFTAAIWVGIVGLTLSGLTAIQIIVGVLGLAFLYAGK